MQLDVLGLRSRTIWRRLVTGGPYVNEAMSISVLSLVILIGIGVIALADHSVSSFPLASLYILPLTLCALVYPFRATLLLCLGCWLLHDFVTPFREHGTQQHVLRGGTTLLGYLVVVGVLFTALEPSGDGRLNSPRKNATSWLLKFNSEPKYSRASCLDRFRRLRASNLPLACNLRRL